MSEMIAGQAAEGPFRWFLRSVYRQVKGLAKSSTVPVGSVRWGTLRRTNPLSRRYGYDRGKPIDRHYIENFLATRSSDIKGRVLEIKGPDYTRNFGAGRVTQSDVLDIDPKNPLATIIADLNEPTPLASDSYDCIIFTQTLQYIFRVEHALAELHRSLKPGGVLLMTVPAITPSPLAEQRHWSFTQFSVERMLDETFGAPNGEVWTRGNLITATAFLYGMCAEDLRRRELEYDDPEYPLLIAARAVKASL